MHTNGHAVGSPTAEDLAGQLIAAKSALLRAAGTINSLQTQLDAAQREIQAALASIDASHRQAELTDLLKAPANSRW